MAASCASTYALIDCCVASAVSESVPIPSSSSTVEIALASPLNLNELAKIVAEFTVIALESPASIVSTDILSLRSNVTPLPATVAVIESPLLNSKLSPAFMSSEPVLEDESPMDSVPPATESTYALIDC